MGLWEDRYIDILKATQFKAPNANTDEECISGGLQELLSGWKPYACQYLEFD